MVYLVKWHSKRTHSTGYLGGVPASVDKEEAIKIALEADREDTDYRHFIQVQNEDRAICAEFWADGTPL